MDEGSIQEVTERLKSWAIESDRGLARVEWDSMDSRRETVSRLKSSLPSGVPFLEIDLPAGSESREVASNLIKRLREADNCIASITGIEWAFPKNGKLIDTLVALSFQREALASLPVRQIWWIPTGFAELFILGVPDLDSWFQLRLHLTEKSFSAKAGINFGESNRKNVSVDEAQTLARKFWDRLETAQKQGIPEERIWLELAEPAVDALIAAGMQLQADEIFIQVPNAHQQLEHQLEEIESIRGSENSEWLSLAERMAHFSQLKGDVPAARQLLERVLEVRKHVMGEEHPDTLTSMNNLAEIIGAQGDLSGARQLQERVLEIGKLVLGEEHPNTLTSMNNLAITLSAQGHLPAARQFQERVLEVRTRVLGEKHPNTLASMNNLAETLRAQGDLSVARQLQERAVEGIIHILGEAHPDTLTSMNNLAETLREQGDLPAALQLQERVLEARTRVLGKEHPNTLASMNNLAITLFYMSDRLRAIQLLQKCLLGQRKLLGNSHPNTLKTSESLRYIEEQ